MLNNKVVKQRVVLSVCFAALAVVSGIASCGGRSGDNTTQKRNPFVNNPLVKTTVHAFATPSLINYGDSAKITWTSTDSNSCSASPTSKISTGTDTGTGTAGEFTTTALTENTTFTISCTGDTGTQNQPVTVSVGSSSIIAAAACTPYPPLTGTTYYYCDCGTGADPDCKNHIGNDSNPGTMALPRRTIEKAMTFFASTSMKVNDTVALCRGGAFNVQAQAGLNIGTNRCGAGSACNDLRDYTPAGYTGSASAKPIINSAAGGANLFTVAYAQGGVRFLNLVLKGNNSSEGLFFYNGAHDLVVCNTDLDAFNIAIQSSGPADGSANPTNITITGNNITNSSVIGSLGGGNNFELSYNNWEGNGGNQELDHTIYIAGAALSKVSVIGNYVHGQYGPTCLGGPFMSHGSVDGLQVKNNIISIDAAAATAGCWGLSYGNNTANTHSVYFRNTVISGNTIINGGNQAMSVSSCPGCIIENNVIIQNWASGGAVGITVATFARNATRGDDLSDANVIRNNTVWFGHNATGTSIGIATNSEGTGHIISNNTVSSTQASGTLNCFRHDLPLKSYAFINNNHCYATGTYNFEYTYRTWDAWKTHANSNPSSNGFDSASVTGSTADPKFTTPGTNFIPVSGSSGGSPLIGAGTSAGTSAVPSVSYMSQYDNTAPTPKLRPSNPAIGAYEP